jgi:sugar phosphate isomerase/epimerase
MRFGIMAMQIGALAPPGLTAEGAMAHLIGFDYAAHVRRIAEQGFKTIELGGDLLLFFPNSYSPQSVQGLAELKAELGLSYTLHLPLWSVEPSTPLAPVREGSVRALIQVIQATRSLGVENYVLHATGPLAAEFYHMRLPETARGLLMRLFQANAAQSIQTILAETGLPSRRLAIETIEFPFDLTLELADNLNLSICLDTGHVLAGFSGPVEIFEVLKRALPRLAQLHLHDAPWQGPEMVLGYGKDHQTLGTGDLDTGRLLDRLSAANFGGPLIFELTIEEARASLEVVRRLRPGILEG